VNGPALAIEMSQRGGSIAIGDGTRPPQARALPSSEKDRSDPLMAAIDALARDARVAPGELSAIVVSAGPGGFTGLRVSVTAAKLLAETLDRPLVAVPSALVAAAGTDRTGRTIVALASKRETAWITVVEGRGRDVAIVGEPGIRTASEIDFAALGVSTLLADEFAPPAIVERARSSDVTVLPPRFHAESCLEVGLAMLQRGELADPVSLAPLYPREPEAVTLWRERHGE
jgi:tRNA threonylcarbamoyladenosine biosynthesis protein TsaB